MFAQVYYEEFIGYQLINLYNTNLYDLKYISPVFILLLTKLQPMHLPSRYFVIQPQDGTIKNSMYLPQE